jgi:hypothetical protein
MLNIDNNKIAKKIEELIKAKIKEKGLIKTGKLYNSIKVMSSNGGGFKIEAEDYYESLDIEHNISKEVFESAELNDFIQKEFLEAIERNIK